MDRQQEEVAERARKLFAGPVDFLKSAPSLKVLPDPTYPEIAFAGALGEAGLTYRAVPTQGLTFGLERFEPGTTRLIAVPDGTASRL